MKPARKSLKEAVRAGLDRVLKGPVQESQYKYPTRSSKYCLGRRRNKLAPKNKKIEESGDRQDRSE